MSRKRKRPSHRRRAVDRVVDAVDVQIREVGSDALKAMGDDSVLWWHDCPDNESVVVRSLTEQVEQ